ncbi:hypothetical protein [Peribacillus phoenicis]|uniref:hypothetical protein n=1 Tax=Peribacillus sp. 1P06PA-2 TaxID=3132295 RepID=UPI0039A5A6D3
MFIVYGFLLFYENPQWIEENCDTPAEKLASGDPGGTCFDADWQAVGGKGTDF